MQKIKKILAIILLLCSFLPLSRCTTYVRPDIPGPVAQNDQNSKLTDRPKIAAYDYFIPVREVQLSWIFVLPFMWPLPLMAVQAQAKRAWLKISLRLLEFIFIVFSIYNIYFWVNMGDPLIGGYIAIGCIILYALIFLGEHLVLFFKNKAPTQP